MNRFRFEEQINTRHSAGIIHHVFTIAQKTIVFLLVAITCLSQRPAYAIAPEDLGTFNIAGMPKELYQKALSGQMARINIPGFGENEPALYPQYDLRKLYTYSEIKQFLHALAKDSRVKLCNIGRSEQGRVIYSVEVGSGSKVILLTGSAHAREFAGTGFILKMLADLLEDAAVHPDTNKLLSQFKIVAIPCVNPDGREGIVTGRFPQSAKYNANGIDLNRNYPSFNAGQVALGEKLTTKSYSPRPGNAYPGKFLGECTETQAVMNWAEHYVIKEQAIVHFDLHQQGRLVYLGKVWDEAQRKTRTDSFSRSIARFLRYRNIPEEPELRGEGGSLSDYITSVAAGFKYSAKYGRFCLNTGYDEQPYLMLSQIDSPESYYRPLNRNMRSVTVEIGTRKSLGYGARARQLMASEYHLHNFDKLLPYIMNAFKAKEASADANATIAPQ